MKPLHLRMKAFGSYLHEAEIDFTKFGEHPLFLITGATGGGKTTILDAMCFALYCRATGGRRNWEGMRSLSAPQEEETLVEFTFTYCGTEYKWFRSMQEYYSKRTDSVRTKETHECCRKDVQGSWELLCSGAEGRVREQAEQLLGLTCEQFSQVVVLPQGDFLKLLLSSSREKAALLQTLFATQKWERLTQRMRNRAAALTKQAGQNDAACQSILTREEVQDLAALTEKCGTLGKEYQKLLTLSLQAKEKQEQCNRAYDIASKTASAYDLLQKRENELTAAKVRAEKAEVQHRQAQTALPQAQHLREQAAKLREQAASMQDALDAARKLDTLQKDLRAKMQKREQAQKQLLQAEQIQQEAQARWQKGMAFSDGLNEQVEQMPKLSAAIEAELRANAAAAVATDLREDCPCPVCGSAHHPYPAVPSAQLAELRGKQAEAVKAAEMLKKARAKLKLLEQQREQARQSAEQMRVVLTELQNRISAEEATQKAVTEQMRGSATLTELEQSVRKLRQSAAQLEQQEAQLQKEAVDAQSHAAAAEEALKKAQTDKAESQTQYQLVLLEYRAQPDVQQDTERPDENAARQKRNEEQTVAAQLAEQIGRAAESLQNGTQSCKQLGELVQQGESLQIQYEAASRLSDLLSGRTKQRVPIQQFVLGIMLDDILASANGFFETLSSGRYRLLRKTAPAGGNALGGLDLAVLDAASGGERDVGTLSGGELFLASLSLAFGLSDVVQGYSGAVRLDALFIDEGFGSLDQETLDTAMDALLRLQESGRTVGIISHVTELQDVIKKQLIVDRLPDGSSCVKIVVP